MNHSISYLVCFLFSFPLWAQTLVISDSHGTGAFGGELARLIESKNEKVSFYAFGGTKPVDWVEGNNLTWGYWEHHTGEKDKRGTNRATPKLVELISLHQPKTILIVQGTNSVWKDATEKDFFSIQFLIKSIHQNHARCIWVGPPDLNVGTIENEQRVESWHQLLTTETMKLGCSFIASWTFTHYPENLGDGVHYDQIPQFGQKLAREWAQGVFQRLY